MKKKFIAALLGAALSVQTAGSLIINSAAKDEPEKTPITIKGDVNGDNTFGVADVLMFQNWLLRGNIEMANLNAADFCEDGVLNVYDLCLMKELLITTGWTDVPYAEDLLEMTDSQVLNMLRGKPVKTIIGTWGDPTDCFSGIYAYSWNYGDRDIIVYFEDVEGIYGEDAPEIGTVNNVHITDPPTEEERAEQIFRQNINSAIIRAQTIEQLKADLAKNDIENRIKNVVVLENGTELTEGYIFDLYETRIVRVYFDEDEVIEMERGPLRMTPALIVNETTYSGTQVFSGRDFPDVSFRFSNGRVTMNSKTESQTIVEGKDIKHAWAVDLNGDNRREIGVVLEEKSGEECFYVYDYMAQVLYKYENTSVHSNPPDYWMFVIGDSITLVDEANDDHVQIVLSELTVVE